MSDASDWASQNAEAARGVLPPGSADEDEWCTGAFELFLTEAELRGADPESDETYVTTLARAHFLYVSAMSAATQIVLDNRRAVWVYRFLLAVSLAANAGAYYG